MRGGRSVETSATLPGRLRRWPAPPRRGATFPCPTAPVRRGAGSCVASSFLCFACSSPNKSLSSLLLRCHSADSCRRDGESASQAIFMFQFVPAARHSPSAHAATKHAWRSSTSFASVTRPHQRREPAPPKLRHGHARRRVVFRRGHLGLECRPSSWRVRWQSSSLCSPCQRCRRGQGWRSRRCRRRRRFLCGNLNRRLGFPHSHVVARCGHEPLAAATHHVHRCR